MILVFIEHKDCVLNKTSIEAIAAAQSLGKDLGMKVSAVIPCGGDCSLASEIAGYDLEKVIVAKNGKLGTYTPDGYADAWEAVIKSENPAYVVMSHTYQVRDFAPKVAARFGTEVVGDVIRYTNNGGNLTFTRRISSENSTRTLPYQATARSSSRSSRARSAATAQRREVPP
ncbi:MAG TPA: hypothetical protein PKO33_11885 [Pyrinomonadaceae bacterium]|nr:hypothetical protein [Pyrinomonadaceae bacterium]